MKKILFLSILWLGISVLDVNAKSLIYYENNNGLSFTKEEYDFFTAMYYEGYQENMTEEDLLYFKNVSLNKNMVETVILADNFSTRATVVTSAAKTLKISKIDTVNPTISVVLTWTQNPTVRSYDVIGAYFETVQLVGNVTTKIVYSGGNYNSSEIQNSNNGFGVSIKLPSNASDMKVTQTFKTTKGGKVYSSYQHAITNISLAQSKSYSISYSGYGHVFLFNSGINSKYDCMSGVELSV